MATADEFFNSINTDSAYQRLDEVLRNPTIFPINIDKIGNSLENDGAFNIMQPGKVYPLGDGFEHFFGWVDEPERVGAKNLGVIRLYIPSQHLVVTYSTLLDQTRKDIDLIENDLTNIIDLGDYNLYEESVYKHLRKACKGAAKTDKDQDRDREE